jgi:hypothetical protein
VSVAQPIRYGAPRPRLLSRPTRGSDAGSRGPELIELAGEYGLVLDPWQEWVLGEALVIDPNGRFRALEVVLEVPRQNGKTALVAALIALGSALFNHKLIIYTAHEFKTALETFEFCCDLLQQGPLGDVMKTRRSGVETGIEFANGNRIRFLARSRGSGRGFSSDLLVVDEAFALQPHQLSAVFPTLSAKPNPQIWYCSSAPMWDSVQLHHLRRRAIDGNQRSLLYMGWGVDPENPPAATDRDGWYQANPGMGHRITEDFVEAEQETLTPEEFGRERLGIPDSPDGQPDLDLGGWPDLADVESVALRPLGFGLDITPERDMAAYSVSGLRADGLTHVELVDHLAGTDWIVDRGKALWEKWKAPVWVWAGTPAAGYADVLEAQGVEVKVLPEGGGAAGLFVDAVKNGTVRHRGQYALSTAVAGARKRNIGERYVWAQPADLDITPLRSASLAHWGAMVEPAPPPKRRARVL